MSPQCTVGKQEIGQVYLGTQDIDRVYLGTNTILCLDFYFYLDARHLIQISINNVTTSFLKLNLTKYKSNWIKL